MRENISASLNERLNTKICQLLSNAYSLLDGSRACYPSILISRYLIILNFVIHFLIFLYVLFILDKLFDAFLLIIAS